MWEKEGKTDIIKGNGLGKGQGPNLLDPRRWSRWHWWTHVLGWVSPGGWGVGSRLGKLA